MSLADLRAAIADALTDVDATVYPYLPSPVSLPCVVVGWPTGWDLAPIQYPTSAVDYVIPVKVAVAIKGAEATDSLLLSLIDDVVAALAVDPTFRDNCDSSAATAVTEIGDNADGDIPMMVATIVLEVVA